MTSSDVFTPAGLRAATAGRWVRRPAGADDAAASTPFTGFAVDSRAVPAGGVFIALRGEQFDGHEFLGGAAQAGAAVVVVDRAVAADAVPDGVGVLQVEDTRAALTHLARAHRKRLTMTRVVAITGSAGKTTTKRLVHAVLESRLEGTSAPRSFNNDIGVPLTILAAEPAHRFLVVEVGANAPGEVGRLADLARPDVAVVTSVGRAHLGGFGSADVVAREKAALLAALEPGGLGIINIAARLPEPVLRGVPSIVTFGLGDEADLRLTGRGPAGVRRWWLEVNGQARYEVGLAGRHNAENALAAIAVGRRFGLSDEDIRAGLATVEPDAMRLEPRVVGPVLVVNDAYNANPESMAAALDSFGELAEGAERRVAVLGGMLELGNDSEALHCELADTVVDRDAADFVVLVGPECGPAFERLRTRWPMERVVWVERADEDAPGSVAGFVRSGDAVLLKASRGLALERVEAEIERRMRPCVQPDAPGDV